MTDAIGFVKSCLPLCHARDDAWKKPMLFSIIIHFLILAIGFLPSSIFNRSLDLDEIYTVDLFDLDQPPPLSQPAPPLPAPPVQPVKPAPAAISEHVQPPAPAPVAKIVSLRPRKAKKKVKKTGPSKKEKAQIEQAINRLQRQIEQQKATANAIAAQKEAEMAAKDAVARLRESLHSNGQPPVKTTATGGRSRGSGQQNNLEASHKQYYVAVSRKIHQHWVLPPLQNWSPKLKAIMVVHVRRDGKVTKTYLEQKSDNVYFNSFVEKTLKESLPLPPFPAGMNEDKLEIGLVFHPGGLL